MLLGPAPREREDAVAALRALINARNYVSGDRLPPERELTVELGMSRTTLRRALDSLEREGSIWRHVGKGTFVANPDSTTGGATALARQLTQLRMMRARLCVEPAIAREAAVNASREAMSRIRTAQLRAESAATWADYETQDDRFHKAVADATDNLLLSALFDQLNQVRRAVAWVNVVRDSERPQRRHASFAEHASITAAIEARDPTAAFEAMRRHLGSVSARLFGEF